MHDRALASLACPRGRRPDCTGFFTSTACATGPPFSCRTTKGLSMVPGTFSLILSRATRNTYSASRSKVASTASRSRLAWRRSSTGTMPERLPGVDPEKDIDVTVSKGVLTISAHRQEKTEGKHRSEFRYGAFARSVTLPESADEDHIQALYDRGVLEVTVALKDQAAKRAEKHIPVRMHMHIKPT
jgi:Hsp20/alpha crystallin family protein